MAFAALNTGVSGVSAFTEGVSIVSDNIANVNSVGFKRSEANFASLVTESPQSTRFNPGGVEIKAQRFVDQQGLLQSTQRSTDLAVNGKGFFVVRDNINGGSNDSVEFTRAGNFTPDVNGNLVNASNKQLLGVPLDANGDPVNSATDVNNYQPINTQAISGTADPTENSALAGNLPANPTGGPTAAAAGDIASGAVTPQESSTMSVFDGQGNQTLIDIGFVQTAANTYRVEAFAQNPAVLDTGAGGPHGPDGVLFSGTATFNADGTMADFTLDQQADPGGLTTPGTVTNTPGNPVNISVPMTFASNPGVSNQTVDFNLGTLASADGLNQNDALFSVQDTTDGAVFGEVVGVDVREDGIVSANFNNGVSRDIFQIPLATFNNPNALTPDNGGAFQQNGESGNPNFAFAGRSGGGTLQSGTLEQSTVDLASEFSDLIVNQRGFSANARVISTSDEILQELTNII